MAQQQNCEDVNEDIKPRKILSPLYFSFMQNMGIIIELKRTELRTMKRRMMCLDLHNGMKKTASGNLHLFTRQRKEMALALASVERVRIKVLKCSKKERKIAARLHPYLMFQ